jgi:DNA-binding transcriptional MocR family regulator
MPIDERGPLLVPAGVQAVVITPRGQNPTGAALGRDLQIPPGVLVIEDDHLGDVAGVPARTLTPGRDRWAVIRSTSKWLGPDLRLAVVTGDAATLRRVQGRQAVGPGWVSTLIQRTVAALRSDPDIEALAEQAATVYAGRRRALLTALQGHGIAATGATGLNVWIPVEDEDAVVAGLLAAGWAVTPGARFRLQSPPAIRVTASTLRPEEARRLAADLAAVLATPLRRAS